MTPARPAAPSRPPVRVERLHGDIWLRDDKSRINDADLDARIAAGVDARLCAIIDETHKVNGDALIHAGCILIALKRVSGWLHRAPREAGQDGGSTEPLSAPPTPQAQARGAAEPTSAHPLVAELRGWKETPGMSDDARRKMWLMRHTAAAIETLHARCSMSRYENQQMYHNGLNMADQIAQCYADDATKIREGISTELRRVREWLDAHNPWSAPSPGESRTEQFEYQQPDNRSGATPSEPAARERDETWQAAKNVVDRIAKPLAEGDYRRAQEVVFATLSSLQERVRELEKVRDDMLAASRGARPARAGVRAAAVERNVEQARAAGFRECRGALLAAIALYDNRRGHHPTNSSWNGPAELWRALGEALEPLRARLSGSQGGQKA